MNEKHIFMKPKDSARIGRQVLRRAKKWQSRLSAALLCTLLFTVFFSSCRDEDLMPSFRVNPETLSRVTSVGSEDGLVQQTDGTWKAMHRVPLVGAGRIIDNFNTKAADVGQIPGNPEYVIDLDLTNTYDVQSVIGLDAVSSQVISIRDLNYTYSGGQKAGFVCTVTNESALTLEVIRGFWVATYKKGELVETKDFKQASGLVDLGLGNIDGGDNKGNNAFSIEASFSLPFDEVRLGCYGVGAGIAENMKVYYAYVGDNEMIPAIDSRTDFFYNGVSTPRGANWTGWADDVSLGGLTNDDLTDGPLVILLAGLFQPHVTVDFGRTIEPGSEVGFVITTGGVLGLGLGKTVLVKTYDSDDFDAPVESYTHTKMVSLGLLGGGQTKFSMITTKPCSRVYIGFFGVDLTLLDGYSINYAFVREPDKLDASSFFTLSNATIYNPSYRFADPPEVGEGIDHTFKSVSYNLVGAPSIDNVPEDFVAPELKQNANGEWILTNMFVQGDYVVEGTYVYEDSEGEHTIVRRCTITRLVKDQTYCNNALINTDDAPGKYEAYEPDDDDIEGVITIGAFTPTGSYDDVVDQNNQNNYLQFNQNVGIHVGRNAGLVGVKTTDHSLINEEGHTARVGFIIDRSNTVLNTEVLNFLRIRLLKNGKQVDAGVGDDNHGVSLSLIGVSGSGQARLSIDTDVAFDAIELYSSGLVDLNLGSSLKVYYAFCEDADADCGTPGEECMQLITTANYRATATIDQGGLVNLINVFEDFGNMLDGDMESFAIVVQTLNLAGGVTLSVKFDPIPIGQEVGLILSGVTGLANLEAIGVEEIQAWNDGEEVQSTTSGGAVGLKVAGNGDKSYVSITPTSDDPSEKYIDEIRYVWGDGVSLLKNIKIHGVYLRPDYDLDGVMDCVEDELTTNILGLELQPADICEGDDAILKVSGGEENKVYDIELYQYDEDAGKEYNKYTCKVRINSASELEFVEADEEGNWVQVSSPIPDLKAGIYYFRVPNPANEDTPWLNYIKFTVHPQETTWLGKKSSDWNDWDNWDNGVPWECTNVILPASSQYRNQMNDKHLLSTSSPVYYPVLEDEVDSSTPFCCDNIHFEPGAELIGQKYLKYTKALIDVNINPGYYHLFSAPLQNMVTGDMFVLEEGKRDDWAINWRTLSEANGNFEPLHHNYFLPVNSDEANGAYEEHRINPLISQRFWSKNVTNVSMSRSLSADNPYNTADQAIVLMTDWSRSFNAVNTVYECGQGFALMVEKKDNATFYEFHFPKAHTAYHYYTIGGGDTGTGASISRSNLTTGRLMEGNITLKREEAGSCFLFGNPLMASINIQKFMNGNPSIQSVKVYQYKEGNAGEYVTISKDGTSTISNPPMFIAPMQALFVETSTSGETCSITLTDDMTIPDYVSQTSAAAPNQLRLTATSRGHSASCVVVPSSAASDDYDAREDATLLVGSEEGSGVAVYTVAGGKALSIQRMNQSGRIPVGFYLKEEGNVTLSFDPQGDAWQGWNLVDQQTGKRYPLDSETNLGTVKSGAGRFYLERTGN